MEASRWLHLAKAGDLKVVVGCAGIAERERDWIGSSTGGVSGRRGRRAIRRRPVVHWRVGGRGRGGGGIHRCGSLGADDCGLIDRRRAGFSWDVLRLNQERRRRHERLIRVDSSTVLQSALHLYSSTALYTLHPLHPPSLSSWLLRTYPKVDC